MKRGHAVILALVLSAVVALALAGLAVAAVPVVTAAVVMHALTTEDDVNQRQTARSALACEDVIVDAGRATGCGKECLLSGRASEAWGMHYECTPPPAGDAQSFGQ